MRMNGSCSLPEGTCRVSQQWVLNSMCIERDVFKFRAQKVHRVLHHFQGKMLERSLILRPNMVISSMYLGNDQTAGWSPQKVV